MTDPADEFPWDYSYFKWLDIPREVRRQMVLDRSWAARTWINGRTTVQMDVPFAAARELYNKNWDGCRDLWKAIYRARKHPGQTPPIQYSQTRMMGWAFGRIHDGGESSQRPKRCCRPCEARFH